MFYANMGSDGQDPGPNYPNTQMLHPVHGDRPVGTQTQLESFSSLAELMYQFRGERKVIEAVSSVYNLPLSSYPQTNKKSAVIISFAFSPTECNKKITFGSYF